MNVATYLSLYANQALHGRILFQGLNISIENRAGSVRSGTDPSGKPWATTMTYPYGYIRMTQGVDGDHVDCFIGPNHKAKNAYVVHVKKPPTFEKFDEDKCFLGFDSADAAKKAFVENYNDPKFFGSMEQIPMEKFKEKVLATKDNPKRIAAYSPDEPRVPSGPGGGQWTSGGGGDAVASPNISEGTNLDEAVRMLDSERHGRIAALAKNLATHFAGIAQNAIGSWKDGAEDSIVVHGNMDMESTRYVAARIGFAGDQKGVIAWQTHGGGTDAKWTVSIGSGYTMRQVSDTLDKVGIADRTIVPKRGGYDVVVYDFGSNMEPKIAEVAKNYGTNYERRRGTAAFIGGNTRAEGRREFERVINEYEGKHGRIQAAIDRQDGRGRGTGRGGNWGRSSAKRTLTPLDKTMILCDSYGGPQSNYLHLDVTPTIHPPSLRNPEYLPVPDMRETDDRFGDVTRRRKAQDLKNRVKGKTWSDSRQMGVTTTQIPWQPIDMTAAAVKNVQTHQPSIRLWAYSADQPRVPAGGDGGGQWTSGGGAPPSKEVQDYVAQYSAIFPSAITKFSNAVEGMGQIAGRVKNPSSLEEKLQRKGKTLDQITDTIGLRLTAPDIATVYRALDSVTQSFKVTKVDDRIEKPLDGIYRAIHVDAEMDGKKMEIQLRTKNQSNLAEFSHETLYKRQVSERTDPILRSYLKKLSTALYRRDMGEKTTLPDCPPVIRDKVGCITMMASSHCRIAEEIWRQPYVPRRASSALLASTLSRRRRRTI